MSQAHKPRPPDRNLDTFHIDKGHFLAQCPLFANLNAWEVKSIAQLMSVVEFRKNEIAYREGEESDSFYVLISGRFEAYVGAPEKKKVLAYLRRGDYFGEMSLLTNQPHSATLRALSDSLTLRLKKDDFRKTVEHNATVSFELSRLLSSRVRGSGQRSRSMMKNDVVSILSRQPRFGMRVFSINLAASLFHESRQKTVLIDLNGSVEQISRELGLPQKIPIRQFQNLELSSPEAMARHMVHHPSGFDVLNVDPEESNASRLIASLVNHLTLDYRFILMDLPMERSELVFKALTQSDALYFVTDSSMNNIIEVKEAVAELERSVPFPEEKIAVVLNEAMFGIRTTTIARKEIFGKKLCFSLPAASETEEKRDWNRMPLVVEEPEAEYSRVVRHIARYISNNLVGLALGSGAALGLAHIGVLRVLEREKIPVDIISGSSVGAMIASLFALGKSADDIEKIALQISHKSDLARLLDICFPPIRGLVRGNKIVRFFKRHIGDKGFDHCRIPLKVIGANLSTRQVHVFESGYVVDAIRASISIPAIFRPVFINGEVVVDGGIFNPLPIHVLRQAGANKIIAVNVFPTAKDTLERRILQEESEEREAQAMCRRNLLVRWGYHMKKYLMKRFSANVFDILMNTIQAMESEIAETEGQSADILIRPVMPTANWIEFYKSRPFIRRGEEEAMRMLPKIKELVSQTTG